MNAGMRVDELMMATTTIASIKMKYLGYVAISLTSIINYHQACNLGIYRTCGNVMSDVSGKDFSPLLLKNNTKFHYCRASET